MNFNEFDDTPESDNSGHSLDPETLEPREIQSSQEALGLPSIPSDPEWVSPFTLPPLPALRKTRGQSNILRSPEERLHERVSSSAYYAAAWGSPYATPSPNRSPPVPRPGGRSQDFGTASPLSFRAQETGESLRERSQKPPRLAPNSSLKRRRANSWDKQKSLSERFNWLSESDLSGGEADIRIEGTPTRDTYLRGLKESVSKTASSGPRTHQMRESTATITPETFHAASDSSMALTNGHDALHTTMERENGDSQDAPSPTNATDKPLPSLPLLNTVEKKPEIVPATASPSSPSRPRLQTSQSFQRPKRKVPWKGKTCIIALPLTDREEAGLPPLLSFDEVKTCIERWVTHGHDAEDLINGDLHSTSGAFGQSRPLYPDPRDMYAERKGSKFHVSIPNQADWDAWVEYLKEEKLRALGVTPSNSEAPMSVQSPFSSTLSRVSSAFPSVAPSPPMGTLSANGNPIHIANNTFSPPLSLGRGGLGSHGGSHAASPSISGYPGPMHGYKQSIAQPRMNSPFDYPINHPGSFGPGMRNTPNSIGVRQFSPPTHPNLQSFGQVLSPIIPTVPSNDSNRGTASQTTMESIRQTQQRQQQFHQQQHQRQQSYFPPQTKSVEPLPRTPILESPTRHTPEIMHPTPRSHRHNLSAALQKGIDDAEAARGVRKTDGEADSNAKTKAAKDDVPGPAIEESAENVAEEEQEPELPVLRRPETLPQDDDRSEIETNPSIAASPMLVDDKNPFATPFSSLQQIKDALQPQTQTQTQTHHKPNISISKLNVEAPAFSPSSSAFTFGGNAFQSGSAPVLAPNTVQKQLVGGSRPSFTPKNLSLSKLNVDAPAFTPSFVAQSTPAKDSTLANDTPAKQSVATPSKSSFTFSSPAFNVEAPEFKPGQSFSFNAGSNSTVADNALPLTSIGSIFGNVVVDANSKVSRRGAKALPIIRPTSAQDEESEAVDDDEGRVGAPSDRQKRARRSGGEEDETLLFANSAPFDHAEGLSGRSDTPAGKSAQDEAVVSDNVEKAKNDLDAIKEMSDEKGAEMVAVAAAEAAEDVPEPSSTVSNAEASTVNTDNEGLARSVNETIEKTSEEPNNNMTTTAENEESAFEPAEHPAVEDARQLSDKKPELSRSTSDSSHKAKTSLSALAKPFEFRPPAAVESVKAADAAPPPKAKKSGGLMASRFAADPSPEPEATTRNGKKTSPPHELYEYVRPEDYTLNDTVSTQEQSKVELITPKLPNMPFESTPELMKSIEDSMRSEALANGATRTPSQASRVDEPMPSYEEIDAVMKQFETNPDLGVERDDSPIKSTPLVDMRLPPTFRSDAPSPSPRHPTMSPQRRADFGLGIHKLSNDNDDRSDWDDDFSPQQEHKIHAQAHYFDGRVNGVVENILESRLGPLEHTLQSIKHSIALITAKPRSGGRRSISTDKKESDADDEDDYDAFEGFSSYRSRSPSRGQRKADKIRAAIMDAMASYQAPIPEQPAFDMSEIHGALDELRKLSQQTALKQQQQNEKTDMRAVMEEVIANHPRFRTPSNQDDHEAIQETYKLKTDVLESSLREAEKKADEEASLRRQAEDDMQQLNRKLLEVQEIAASHREASEEAQVAVQAFSEEKEAHRELRSSYENLIEKNKALEDLLGEYRVTTDQLREDAKTERGRNQDLIRVVDSLREDFNDKMESRQALKSQMVRLQDRMAQVLQDVHDDEAEWHKKEQELNIQNRTIQAALDHEIRHREKIEIELDGLDKEHKENMRFRSQHEHAQQEILRLQSQIARVVEENKSHQDQTFKLERELAHIRETTDNEVTKATTRLEAELQAARATLESLQVDSEAQVSRLQKRVDDAELDLEEQKAKHDSLMAETAEAHSHAIHEASQKREVDLEEQHKSHEKKLNDLRERHTRALHNSSDDRHRLEHQLNERLAISEERTTHLQSQVKDLEERLEVTRSAARAAVEAATAKSNNLPTPAPSVVASPPQRLSSASLQLVRGTDIPEKISPQALRESIMVLQEQLQNREQKIEQLEVEVAALDKEAPAKIRERDNEITLLRELLSVRVDDLNEIISTLSQPSYDRDATKNAAIRLRANLQMEQQLKERAASISGLTSSLPSISAITNFAQSPKGLPMAAAAAWGNWRKARDFSLNAVSDIATNISQTPSKSTVTSPSSFLAGIMTPPSTSQRTPPPEANPPSPTMRPLAAAAAAAARKNTGIASEARPLRTYSKQARTLSSRQAEKRRESAESTSSESSRQQTSYQADAPSTPTASRSSGSLDLGDDIDEDASPFDASQHESQSMEAEAESVAT